MWSATTCATSFHGLDRVLLIPRTNIKREDRSSKGLQSDEMSRRASREVRARDLRMYRPLPPAARVVMCAMQHNPLQQRYDGIGDGCAPVQHEGKVINGAIDV